MTSRIPNLDAVRFVSAFAVIWFHSGNPGHELAYAGLACFILLTTYFEFGCNYSRRDDVGEPVWRLLRPWLCWAGVFALINLVRGAPLFPFGADWLSKALIGPAIHLWYLPFMTGMIVLGRLARRNLEREQAAWLFGLAALAFLAAIPLWRGWSLAAGAPWAQYLHGLGLALIGAFLANHRAIAGGLYILAAIGLLLGWHAVIGTPGIGIAYAVAVAIVLSAIYLPQHGSALFRNTSPALMLIYLMHPIFLSLFGKLPGLPALAVPPLVFVVTLIIARAIVSRDWLRPFY